MLKLNSIGHSVAEKILFNNVSFSLTDKKYGLVGPNGVGKTTLAKIIAGMISPSHGQVIANGPVFYFAQYEPQTDILLSEYLMDIWDEPSEFTVLISSLVESLNLNRKVSQLSGGEWMKARLAKAISRSPGFLILDEPSNNLDYEGKQVVLDFLASYTKGLLLISHDRALLERMEVIIELSNQGASFFGGNFDFYWQERQAERERQEEDLARLKKEKKAADLAAVKKLDRQAKRMRAGSDKADKGDMPRILVGARKRRAQVSLGKIVKHERAVISGAQEQVDDSWSSMKIDPFVRLNFAGAKVHSGKILAEIKDFNWHFKDVSSEHRQSHINLSVQGPQRWHLQGKNGSGKSTLLKLIVNPLTVPIEITSGGVKTQTKAIAYLDQKYGLLDPSLSILENIQLNTRFSETELRNELAFYGFTAEKVFQSIQSLSGGELLKASLAQIFLGREIPELIILDEPTNNLDILSITLLEKALENFAGALIVVSHDKNFIKNLKITNVLNLSESI